MKRYSRTNREKNYKINNIHSIKSLHVLEPSDISFCLWSRLPHHWMKLLIIF